MSQPFDEVQEELTRHPQQHGRADDAAVQECEQGQSQLQHGVHRVGHHLPESRYGVETVLGADENQVDHRVDEVEYEAEHDAQALPRLPQDAASRDEPAVQQVLDVPRHVAQEVSRHLEDLKGSPQWLQPALHRMQGSIAHRGNGLRGGEEREEGKVPVFSQRGPAWGWQCAGQEANQPAKGANEQVEQEATSVDKSANGEKDQVHLIHFRLLKRERTLPTEHLELLKNSWYRLEIVPSNLRCAFQCCCLSGELVYRPTETCFGKSNTPVTSRGWFVILSRSQLKLGCVLRVEINVDVKTKAEFRTTHLSPETI